ncbi:sensor histidine kinase [Flexithrix dorotheae]|uniref:sensor histidine kinase n=1 Tax=Flexithrix dorotheae TaxID=70993 RepID=UPI0012FC45CD|nr:histidine kinase [Flexithrix dorotheae]
MMNKYINLLTKEIVLRHIGIVVVSLLLPLFRSEHMGNMGYWKTVPKAIVFTAIFWEGTWAIIFWFRRKYPHFEQTSRRIMMTIISCIVFIFISDILLCAIIAVILGEPIKLFEKLGEHAFFNLSITAFIGVIYESSYFFRNWKNSVLIAEKLKTQQLKTEVAALKNQLSPHFLFNSLNTLVTLINEDTRQATSFTEKLSEVYRYILQNKDKELVTLETELQFIKSYVFLLKMRFKDNFQIECDIPSEHQKDFIAPLTLQMLVENAVKHNIMSTAKPLNIFITIENGKSIVVKNNLQQKSVVNHSTKTGLENIIKRYKYLSNQAVDVVVTTSNFIVALPLIKLTR